MKRKPDRRSAANSRPAAKRSQPATKRPAATRRRRSPAARAAEPNATATPCDVVASILSRPAFRQMPPDAQLAFLENLAFLSGVLHYR